MSKVLNSRQKTFAKNYAMTGNATKSARTAGYENPNVQGSRLLSNDSVTNYIDGLVQRADVAKGLTPDAILVALVEIATDSTAKHADKLRALELIGKNKRMFADGLIVETKDDEQTVDNLKDLVDPEIWKQLKDATG